MTLPRRFHLDHQLRFLKIEGEAGDARLGTSLRDLCTPALWDVFHRGFRQVLTTRSTLTYEEEIPGMGLYIIELYADLAGVTVRFEPRVVFSAGADSEFEKAPQLLCLLEREQATILRANPAWSRTLGYQAAGLVGRSLYDFIPECNHSELTGALKTRPDGETVGFTGPFLAADGEYHDLQWCFLHESATGPLYAAAKDLSPRQSIALALRRQTYTDPLTNLPNRLAIEERIQSWLTRGGEGGFGVLVLGLDRFKWVNEALRQEGGDQVLKILAGQLLGSLRPDDVIGRLQGDVFVALLAGVANEQQAGELARKVLSEVQKPFTLQGTDVRLTASVGLAIAPVHGTTARVLLERADTAMYEAKKASRGAVAVWRDGMALSAIERMALESRLARAVDRGEMLLHYQQQVSATTQQLVGFEALVRWSDPQRGLVPPDTFIPLAEDAGLIGSIGHWVLEEACRQGAVWNQAMAGLGMSVNLSGRQFAQINLLDQINEVLDTTGLKPERLDLEITETELMCQDESHVRKVLVKLRDMGVQLSVDDYGIGYTNWRRLAQLPIDRIKIDKSFITQVCHSVADEAVIRAIVDLAHTLQMKVVAEGVETEEQHHKLVALGCDVLQGYRYGRPISAQDARLLLPTGG